MILYLINFNVILAIDLSVAPNEIKHNHNMKQSHNATGILHSNLNNFDWYSEVPWKNVPISKLKSFIHLERKRDFIMYCADSRIRTRTRHNVIDDSKSLKVIELQSKCIGKQKVIEFSGILDESSLPKGPGTAHIRDTFFTNETYKTICYKTLPSVTAIDGLFKNGIPHGLGKVYYADGNIYTGYLYNGSFHGPVKILISISPGEHQPLYFGSFVAGRPYGPAWLFTSSVRDGVFYLNFESGDIITTPCSSALFDFDSNKIFIGSILDNSQFYNFYNANMIEAGSWNCMKILKLCSSNSSLDNFLSQSIALPYIITTYPEQGRINLQCSNILYFTRVAKTGSQGVIAIMHALKKLNRYKAYTQFSQVETIMDSFHRVQNQVDLIAKYNEPAVWIRHYGVIDFKKHGASWSPQFVSIVRNPIDRVNNVG